MEEEPLAVTVLGLKPALTPEGSPLTLNPTVPVNPFTAVTVAVYGALPPAATDTLDGVTANEKSAAAVTVRLVFAVWVRLPLVALTVRGYVPVDVPLVVVRVMVVGPLPVTVAGLKAAVAPAGKPFTVNPTVPVNPLNAVTVTVY